MMRSLSDAWRIPFEFVSTTGVATGEISRRLEAWQPNVGEFLNVSPPVDFSGRSPLGLINVWVGLVRLEGADGREEPVALLAAARWTKKGQQNLPLIAQAWAPVHPADTARRVRVRTYEHSIRLLKSSLGRALAERRYPPPALQPYTIPAADKTSALALATATASASRPFLPRYSAAAENCRDRVAMAFPTGPRFHPHLEASTSRPCIHPSLDLGATSRRRKSLTGSPFTGGCSTCQALSGLRGEGRVGAKRGCVSRVPDGWSLLDGVRVKRPRFILGNAV